jgi:small-conductance mechanosensitive channel
MMLSLGLALPLAGQGPAPAAAKDSAAGARQRAAPRPGAPVVLGSDTVLWVYARAGSFTAEERAEAVRRRLAERANDPFSRGDSPVVRRAGAETDVLIGGRILMADTDADAAAAGIPRDSLALLYARAAAGAVRDQGFWARARAIGMGVLFALLVLLALLVALRLISRGFPRLYAFIDRGRTSWVPAFRIQKLEILTRDQIADGLRQAAKLLRLALLAVLFYLSVPAILSFFPWTRPYAGVLVGYILSPFAAVASNIVLYLPSLFTLVVIVIVTHYLLRVIRLVFAGLGRGHIRVSGFYPEWATPTYKLVRLLVLAFAFIAAWPYLPGSDSAAFQGVGVFLGVLLSLGSASAVGNMIGGVMITYIRPFRVGDRVKIADTVGDVVAKDLLVTRIRTIKNVDVTVPNSMVLASHIVNYSSSARQQGLILSTTVTIGYDTPWRRVHELLISAARATPGIVETQAPFVLQTSLDDFYVSYELNAYTDQPNRMAVLYSELHARILDHFNRAGVEIMSPHYRAERDGNPVAIPAAGPFDGGGESPGAAG